MSHCCPHPHSTSYQEALSVQFFTLCVSVLCLGQSRSPGPWPLGSWESSAWKWQTGLPTAQVTRRPRSWPGTRWGEGLGGGGRAQRDASSGTGWGDLLGVPFPHRAATPHGPGGDRSGLPPGSTVWAPFTGRAAGLRKVGQTFSVPSRPGSPGSWRSQARPGYRSTWRHPELAPCTCSPGAQVSSLCRSAPPAALLLNPGARSSPASGHPEGH